jgi:membrane associated rhomboid family serine protease
MNGRQPIFNVPASVVAVLAVLVGVHVVRQLLPEETSTWLTLAMAFIPARYSGMAAEIPGGETAAVTSLFTNMLVHGDAAHLIINSVWMLAFGGLIARRIGALRFLLLALLSGIAGNLAFLALHPAALVPVIGASGAVSGLLGAVMRFMFSAFDETGLGQLRRDPRSARRMSVRETLSDPRILASIAIWLGLNVLATFGVGVGVPGEANAIAWEAHVGGFAAGLLAFGYFDFADIHREP